MMSYFVGASSSSAALGVDLRSGSPLEAAQCLERPMSTRYGTLSDTSRPNTGHVCVTSCSGLLEDFAHSK